MNHATKLIYSLILLSFCFVSSANECALTVASTDMMQYDSQSLSVKKSCSSFSLELIHKGNLAKNVMGHNVVIVPTDAFNKVIAMINMSEGIENGFLPDAHEILAKTAMIGGGEQTKVDINLESFEIGKAYTFFCSFPGHYAIMKGKLEIL